MRTVGILGGGQLGRMLALAGYPLEIRCRLWDPASDACAGQVAPLLSVPYTDPDARQQFIDGLECVTYEFENVDLELVQALAQHLPVHPTPEALRLFQDRLIEKQTLRAYGVPPPAFAEVDPHRPERALEVVGLPAVLKTRRFGYDGKGQAVVRTAEELEQAVQRFGTQPLILEAFIPFDREVSTIGVRSRSGEFVGYPLIENWHDKGILRLSLAGDEQPPPAPLSASTLTCHSERSEESQKNLTPLSPLSASREGGEPYSPSPFTERGQGGEVIGSVALTSMRQLMEALDYVGVMTIEWFQVGSQLLANEVAPRVHNSGHWTIEGAETSQFENHLRAVLGLPLGATTPRGYSAMVNLIGAIPPAERVLQIPHAHLHLYGKEPRPGRKVGHITLRADTPDERNARLVELLSVLREVLAPLAGVEAFDVCLRRIVGENGV